MDRNLKRKALSSAVMAAVLLPAYSPIQVSAAVLEEIVVTANRREQNIQDVGVVVEQFSGDDLKDIGVTDTGDLAQLIPGVYSSGAFGGQSQQFTIRGVTQSDFSDTIEAPVAFYIDDVYLPAPQGQTMAFFDLDRVEVLKGPQGTLFGRNATGGLVHTVIAKPNTEEVEGYVNLSYGNFNETNLEAALNLPLSDTVAIRVSGMHSSIGDIWDNKYPTGAPGSNPILSFDGPGGASEGVVVTPNGEDLGKNQTDAARLQLLFDPNEDLRIRLSGSYAKTEMSISPYTSASTIAQVDENDRVIQAYRASATETRLAIGPNGGNYLGPALAPSWLAAGIFERPVPGGNWFGYKPLDADDLELSSDFALDDLDEVESKVLAAHVEYNFGNVVLNSVTSYQDYDKEVYLDIDGSPVNALAFGSKSGTEAWSQEIRLSGDTDKTRWQVGLFYLSTEVELLHGILEPTGSAQANIGTFFTGIPFIVEGGADLVANVDFESESYSAFGQVEIDVAENYTLIVGARFIQEDQKDSYRHFTAANLDNYAVEGDIFVVPAFQPDYSDDRSENMWAAKLQLEYRPSEDWLLYAGLNRGVKAGNYNSPFTFSPADSVAVDEMAYDPEELLSYEVGFKYSNGVALLNMSAFYYDYSDYQAFVFNTASGIVKNVDAEVYGFDVDAAYQLTDSLTLSVGGAYSHGEIDDFEVAPGVFRTVRPTYAPRTQANGNLSYLVPKMVFDGELSFTLNVNYASEFYHNIRNFDAHEFDGRTLVNLTAKWANDNGWHISAYGKNLTDKRYGQIGFANSAVYGGQIESYGKPRTYGITIGYEF